jgi:hypothetical protein
VIPARNSPERVGEGKERAKGVTRDRLVAGVGVGTPPARGVPRRGGSLAVAVGYAGGVGGLGEQCVAEEAVLDLG